MNSGIFHCLPFNSSALYYHQTPTRRYGHASTPLRSLPITGHRNMHFRRLWNGMFDRHRAEITVMQFTGHSLPVHHFVTASWDFYLVPYFQPSCILQYSDKINSSLLIDFIGISTCFRSQGIEYKVSGVNLRTLLGLNNLR